MENGKISALQLFILVSMFVLSSSTLLLPSLTAIYAEQDSWIAAIIGVALAPLLVWLYISLGKRYPSLTIIQYSEKILGKAFGKTVSLILCFYFIILTAGLLRQMGDMLVTLVLPDTPIHAVELLFFLASVFAVRRGVEVFARAAEILFPWVLLFFTFLCVALLPMLELKNIEPIFAAGFNQIVRGAINVVGIPFFDLVIFLMVFPYVSGNSNMKKAYYGGALFSGVLVIIAVVLCILVLGADMTKFSTYPVYKLAQKVNIGDFLQRIEVLVGAVWFITLFFKMTVCYYAAVLGISQVSGVTQYKFLTVPIGMIIIAASLLFFPNFIYFQDVLLRIWTPNVTIYGVIIPLILLLTDMIRQHRAKARKEEADGASEYKQ